MVETEARVNIYEKNIEPRLFFTLTLKYVDESKSFAFTIQTPNPVWSYLFLRFLQKNFGNFCDLCLRLLLVIMIIIV